MVDVDHFKRVNDELGHQAGDHALRGLAATLRAVVRTEDVPGRWGGEEFVLLLPYTDFPGTFAMADRTRAVVAATPVVLPSGAELHLTVSVGLSVGRGTPPLELLQRADAALYRAKAAGRNRVEADRTGELGPRLDLPGPDLPGPDQA
jgi:two-component system cell cycle response regulator